MALLEGIRILDLTNVLAGPFCCHQLVHMGAEVIKIEAPGKGDLARVLGADPDLNDKLMGISFLAQNAGKKSVTLNLKDAEGKARFLNLVKTADVVVENFRPGVMKRLGLDAETLQRHKSDLIYCAISGFGQDGPWKDRPAYDQIIQGMSGVMSITGDEASAPLRVGYPIADTIGGMTAAFAIASALAGKERGQIIDISMLESTLATMGWVVSNYLIGGVEPQANGNENVTSAPSGTFQTKDRPINIAANRDTQWTALANALGLEGLLDHPDFCTREQRKANRHNLRARLEVKLTERTAEEWIETLNALGIPTGPVLTVPEILASPQIADRGMIGHFEHVPGIDRAIDVIRTAIKINGEALKVDTPPPELGRDDVEELMGS